MVNRAKNKGTSAETMVVRYLRSHGWPGAERRSLAGIKDQGDVNTGNRKLVIEVKADKGLAFPQFLRETETERVNAGAAVGVCVIKPPGVGKDRMGLWWMLLSSGTYAGLEMYAGPENFMAWWYDERQHGHVKEKGSRAFKVDKCLVHAREVLKMSPGTKLKPGVQRVSSTGWDMRFLYLPDGLELLRLAGLATEKEG